MRMSRGANQANEETGEGVGNVVSISLRAREDKFEPVRRVGN